MCRSARTMLASRKIRCALVHGHVLLRQGLRRLLEDDFEIEIVAESGNAIEALKSVLQQRPEIVLADAAVFGLTPEKIELLLRRISPSTRALFLSMDEESKPRDSRTDLAVTAKHTSAQSLLERIRQIHAARGAEESLRRNSVEWEEIESPAQTRALTMREREVLKLLAEGRTVRSTATVLGLSAKTVDAHKFNLMRKLGIHNKAELVMWAIRQRLVRVPSTF